MYHLYIIKSQTANWHYIGSTDDTVKRLKEHNAGKTKSTRGYKPFKLVYTESFPDRTSARKREIYLKKNYKAREEIFSAIGGSSNGGKNL
jgi:putative endonuclease